MQENTSNLILGGGGVKGIGLVGAVDQLEDANYHFDRIGGTSAGAIVGALVAAGYTSDELVQIVNEFSYPDLADQGLIDRFGIVGKSLSVLFEKGVYEGRVLQKAMVDLLAAKNIQTFGDLRRFGNDAPIEQRYKLVVLAADVTNSRLARFPWDCDKYGLDPDTMLVADAVQASSAIPFFYEPVKLGASYLVDGGLLANFPIWLFQPGPHDHDAQTPTIGIKLAARPENQVMEPNSTSNTFSYAFSVIKTMLDTQDHVHLEDPCTIARTIFVDGGDIGAADFDITAEQKQHLFKQGQKAARKWLAQNHDLTTICPGDT